MAAARHEAEVGKQGGFLRGPDAEQRGTGTDHREVGTAWPRRVHAHRRGRAIQAWHVYKTCTTGGMPPGGLFLAKNADMAARYPMLLEWEEGEVPYPGCFPVRMVLTLS